jgi:4-amino-4-deoxy-L-arabinose transferase-like glycosyltransferase
MPKMSFEGLVGIVIALIVVILDQAGVKNPYVLWVAFAVALLLSLDSTLRSALARNRKIWSSALIIVLFAAFGVYLFIKTHPKAKVEGTKPITPDNTSVQPPQTVIPPSVVPIPGKTAPVHQSRHVQPKATEDNSTHIGGNVDQRSTGPCSPNFVGGKNTVNCAPPPPNVFMSTDPVVQNGKSGITVTLRTDAQLVGPEFTLVFDHTIKEENVNVRTSYARNTTQSNHVGTSGGGPFHNGFHVSITSPPAMPAEGKIFVDVFSDEPIKLVSWSRN